jgi:DNA polymerase III subunit delta'
MNFSDIIGQTAQKNLLKGMVDDNRAPHALLLLGKEGVGGLPLALAYVQYLLCENKQNNETSCGACRACTKNTKMIHPDVHYSYPTIGTGKIATDFISDWRKIIAQNPYMSNNQWLSAISGGENKQGNINKDECVSIFKKLNLKSYESKYKVLIMWLPEYLGKEGNRLLKLIEEPPDDTVFVLVAENQELILNTILSRCQMVKLSPLSNEDITLALTQRLDISTTQAGAIAQIADGNFNEALLLSQSSQNDNAVLFLEWMRKVYRIDGVEILQWVEKFAAAGREAQKYFFRYGLHFIREMMMYKATNSIDRVRLQNAELSTAIKMSDIIEMEQVEPIMHIFDESIRHIERNANAKILLLDASIRVNKILRKR